MMRNFGTATLDKSLRERTRDYAADGKFAVWMRDVDRAVLARTGLSVMDLPDCAFADWFVDHVSVKSAAARAIRLAKEF
jgi:hypothetical protein